MDNKAEDRIVACIGSVGAEVAKCAVLLARILKALERQTQYQVQGSDRD